jgi:hypothetical protein
MLRSSTNNYAGNQRKSRRRFPLEVISVLLLFGVWMWSGMFDTSSDQRSKVSSVGRRIHRGPDPLAIEITNRGETQKIDRSSRRLAIRKAKHISTLDRRSADLNLTTILQKSPRPHRGDIDRRVADAVKAFTGAGGAIERRTIALGKGIKVRIAGDRIFADVRVPMSQVAGIGFGDRMVNISGEVFVESAGQRTRIYLEPSQIDGKEPPGFVRRMLRGMDLYDLFAKDYPIDALLSRLQKRH